MVVQRPCLESDVALREEFHGETKLGPLARLVQLAVVGVDWTVDLHVGGEFFGDEAGGKVVGLGPTFAGNLSDQHNGNDSNKAKGAKLRAAASQARLTAAIAKH